MSSPSKRSTYKASIFAQPILQAIVAFDSSFCSKHQKAQLYRHSETLKLHSDVIDESYGS